MDAVQIEEFVQKLLLLHEDVKMAHSALDDARVGLCSELRKFSVVQCAAFITTISSSFSFY